jgi:hypothetical protein
MMPSASIAKEDGMAMIRPGPGYYYYYGGYYGGYYNYDPFVETSY